MRLDTRDNNVVQSSVHHLMIKMARSDVSQNFKIKHLKKKNNYSTADRYSKLQY